MPRTEKEAKLLNALAGVANEVDPPLSGNAKEIGERIQQKESQRSAVVESALKEAFGDNVYKEDYARKLVQDLRRDYKSSMHNGDRSNEERDNALMSKIKKDLGLTEREKSVSEPKVDATPVANSATKENTQAAVEEPYKNTEERFQEIFNKYTKEQESRPLDAHKLTLAISKDIKDQKVFGGISDYDNHQVAKYVAKKIMEGPNQTQGQPESFLKRIKHFLSDKSITRARNMINKLQSNPQASGPQALRSNQPQRNQNALISH